MSKKLPLRYEREWRWKQPPTLDSGFYKYRIEYLRSVGERVNHYPGYSRESFYEFEEEEVDDIPEYCGSLGDRQSICLADVLEQVKEHGLDPKNVYLTASFNEDYLNVEAVHIRPLDETGQLEEYQDAYSTWAETQKDAEAQEKKRIHQEIQMLQHKLEALKKKSNS